MSALDVSIEALSPDLLEAYAAAGISRGEAGAAAINWTFAHNERPFAVARQHGEVVGFSAYIASDVTLAGVNGRAFQAVDSYVDERCRGQGVFTKLAQAYDDFVQDTSGDLVWGFPNDNAAPVWFKRLGWAHLGQVPLLVKPLRASLLLRRLGLPGDIPLSFSRNQQLTPLQEVGDWADALWEHFGAAVGCASRRDHAFLQWRLFDDCRADDYRVVGAASGAGEDSALVATRTMHKHGGHIAYLMEALGGDAARELLESELGCLREQGAEAVLAWCFPWSPNYRLLRRCGFLPLPERLRSINIWFGARAHTVKARCAQAPGSWYLSYLDSDTV